MWEKPNSSFWLVAALLVLGFVLFWVSQHLDQITEPNLATLPIVFSGGETAACSVLSTIAGSLITLVATTFSPRSAPSRSPEKLQSNSPTRGHG